MPLWGPFLAVEVLASAEALVVEQTGAVALAEGAAAADGQLLLLLPLRQRLAAEEEDTTHGVDGPLQGFLG